MSETRIEPTAPDLPCPKCGATTTSIDYCDGCRLRPYSAYSGNHADNTCAHGDPEHFHRLCRRCHYQWRTDDVNNAQKRCAQ